MNKKSVVAILEAQIARHRATVEHKESELADARKVLVDRETALRVVLELDDSTTETVDPEATTPPTEVAPHSNGEVTTGTLAGKTIMECVRTILLEHHNQPLHYRRIAEVALSRGYTSQHQNGDRKRVNKAFWDMMMKHCKPGRPNRSLEFLGKGEFRLVETPKADEA
jgi:hypothetical protein